jgi:hypothetical protein
MSIRMTLRPTEIREGDLLIAIDDYAIDDETGDGIEVTAVHMDDGYAQLPPTRAGIDRRFYLDSAESVAVLRKEHVLPSYALVALSDGLALAVSRLADEGHEYKLTESLLKELHLLTSPGSEVDVVLRARGDR